MHLCDMNRINFIDTIGKYSTSSDAVGRLLTFLHIHDRKSDC